MKKILYVESDDTSRMLFKKLVVEALEMTVQLFTAKNTKDAEKILEQDKFDLLVSEIYVIDGMDLVRNLRSGVYGCRNKNIPAIAFSAAPIQGEKEKCLKLGFNEHFLIPYKGKKVVSTIKGLI